MINTNTTKKIIESGSTSALSIIPPHALFITRTYMKTLQTARQNNVIGSVSNINIILTLFQTVRTSHRKRIIIKVLLPHTQSRQSTKCKIWSPGGATRTIIMSIFEQRRDIFLHFLQSASFYVYPSSIYLYPLITYHILIVVVDWPCYLRSAPPPDERLLSASQTPRHTISVRCPGFIISMSNWIIN